VFLRTDSLPDYEEAGKMAEKLQQIMGEHGIYTSGMVFYIRGMELQGQDVIALDEYTHNRKNLRNIVSAAFRCFNVAES